MSINETFEDDQLSGRRAAPRMELSLPGQFMSTQGNHKCIVTNLSRSGLRMAIVDPIKVGQGGYLRCGPIDHFMIVTRQERGFNALEFEIPVSDVFVFGIRQFQEQLGDMEREELAATAQMWAEGAETPHR
ncbi:MAG: PilZ domain-containing protein [Erythrobacter sp.]